MSREKEGNERKYFKLMFRKLPEKGYTEEDFQENLKSLCSTLQLPSSSIYFIHFIPGKASKRRGPISSTGYISVGEESIALKRLKYLSSSSSSNASFLSSANTSPAIDLDNPMPATQVYYKVPEVSIAPFPKAFKFKVNKMYLLMIPFHLLLYFNVYSAVY